MNQGQENQQQTTDTDDGAHKAGQAMDLNAHLLRTPQNLYLLWEEYTDGSQWFKSCNIVRFSGKGTIQAHLLKTKTRVEQDFRAD